MCYVLFFSKVFGLLVFEATFTAFFKDKVIKKSQNSKIKVFFYYFCLMIAGSIGTSY
jgi:hypothetical protein